MKELIVLLDVVAALSFLAAGVYALRLPVREAGIIGRGVKVLLLSAAAVYLYVSVSNALETGVIGTTVLDEVEDYFEVLFIPLLVYSAHAIRSRWHYLEQLRAAGFARRQHAFLLDVLDMSPVGTIVVDGRGEVTFASEGARRALGVADESLAAPFLGHPAWTLRTSGGETLEKGFASLCERGTAEDVSLTLTWPDGAQTALLVSAAPMADRTGGLGGYVVALEDVEARRSALGA